MNSGAATAYTLITESFRLSSTVSTDGVGQVGSVIAQQREYRAPVGRRSDVGEGGKVALQRRQIGTDVCGRVGESAANRVYDAIQIRRNARLFAQRKGHPVRQIEHVLVGDGNALDRTVHGVLQQRYGGSQQMQPLHQVRYQRAAHVAGDDRRCEGAVHADRSLRITCPLLQADERHIQCGQRFADVLETVLKLLDQWLADQHDQRGGDIRHSVRHVRARIGNGGQCRPEHCVHIAAGIAGERINAADDGGSQRLEVFRHRLHRAEHFVQQRQVVADGKAERGIVHHGDGSVRFGGGEPNPGRATDGCAQRKLWPWLCGDALHIGVSLTFTSPDYGIPNTVYGTVRLLTSVSDAANYLDTLAAPQLVPANITQTTFNLSNVVQLLQQTGSAIAQDGNSVASAVTNLTQSTSGDPAALFDAANQTIQSVLDHITQLLPSVNFNLTALIGTSVPDQLADGFGRIELRLITLRTQLGTLNFAILAAIAAAGTTSPIPTDILAKYITLRKVYDVLECARKLRAFLPVLRYTLNNSIKDMVEADPYLAHLVATVLQPLSAANEGYYSALKGGVRDLAAFYALVEESTLLLAVYNVMGLGTLIDIMLGKFNTPLANVTQDVAAVALQLQNYLDAVKGMVGLSDPQVISITESKLTVALIHTLIDSGPYSRYCFKKYKDQVTDLLNYLLEESSICIDREIPRLGNLGPAVQSVLDVSAYDFEDINDWLTICDGLQEPANQNLCVTTITQTYTRLGDDFADKYALLYVLTTTEVNASKQRVKICIDLSRR
uniref:Uncharacterized protein n=1 Tax=Anopheles melas TaxID=34690 RepID=A0A182UKL9_9DIPT